MNKPYINILTRIHGKPDYFRICKDSINRQYYRRFNWIVGSDIPCGYYDNYIPLTLSEEFPQSIPDGHYFAPYNLHMETLATHVKDGWIIAIDEDDRFTTPESLNTIAKAIDHEDQMIIWRVRITPNFIVPSWSFGKSIEAGDISGIGYMYHSKHGPVDWGCISYGDYRVAKQLEAKGLELKWINKILTSTISGPHNGK